MEEKRYLVGPGGRPEGRRVWWAFTMKVIWELADVADDMLLMILKIIDFKIDFKIRSKKKQ